MFYERWRTIAAQRHNQLALRDCASGRRWTFGELFAAGETAPVGRSRFVFPQGQSAEFVLAVLGAWRTGKIVCPVEQGQKPRGLVSLLASELARRSSPPIVHVKTTSATTGGARLVGFTAAQLAADAENIMETMGLRPDWPNLGVISLAHSYGFSNLVTPLLLHGIPLILAQSPLPEAIRQAARDESALTLPAVPALWRAWHDADAIPTCVKLAISASAPLPLALEQEVFKTRGLKVHNFYGASECGGIAYDATKTPRTDAACVGTPMRNVFLSVANDGCLKVRGRAVAESYWPQPDATLGNGCFHTSDLADIFGGQVFLRGRASDLINVTGRKVSPETIERVLLQHPQVSDCLVFGVPNPDTRVGERNEEIVAVVVSRAHEEMLRQFVLKTLPAWQVPRHWWFVESLSANERGKVSRAEWRQNYTDYMEQNTQ